MTRWRYAAATDIGLVRQTNQDVLFADDSLAIIADGMGGHAAGDVAAAMSIDLVREGFRQSPSVEGLIEAIQGANEAVLNDARDHPDHFGMGTTVIAVGLTYDLDNLVVPTLVHVGDSRAYQLRDGALRQLSEDHSVAEEWVRMGRLSPDEAAVHPRRHQLTRGVGVEDTIAIDVTSINAAAGDRLLLCSDGLSNELDSDTLARLASAPNGLEMAVESLVSAAKVAGGRDNISVILLEFDEVNVSASPIRRTMNSAPAPVIPVARPGGGRRRLLTWRVLAAALILLGVIGAGVAVIHWYAYSTYYLASDGTNIVVYRGQPSGVLWYRPMVVADTGLPVSRLLPADQRDLAATISEPTLSAALRHAKYLNKAWHLSRTPATTTTTVTTPLSSTTTTVRVTPTTVKQG